MRATQSNSILEVAQLVALSGRMMTHASLPQVDLSRGVLAAAFWDQARVGQTSLRNDCDKEHVFLL